MPAVQQRLAPRERIQRFLQLAPGEHTTFVCLSLLAGHNISLLLLLLLPVHRKLWPLVMHLCGLTRHRGNVLYFPWHLLPCSLLLQLLLHHGLPGLPLSLLLLHHLNSLREMTDHCSLSVEQMLAVGAIDSAIIQLDLVCAPPRMQSPNLIINGVHQLRLLDLDVRKLVLMRKLERLQLVYGPDEVKRRRWLSILVRGYWIRVTFIEPPVARVRRDSRCSAHEARDARIIALSRDISRIHPPRPTILLSMLPAPHARLNVFHGHHDEAANPHPRLRQLVFTSL